MRAAPDEAAVTVKVLRPGAADAVAGPVVAPRGDPRRLGEAAAELVLKRLQVAAPAAVVVGGRGGAVGDRREGAYFAAQVVPLMSSRRTAEAVRAAEAAVAFDPSWDNLGLALWAWQMLRDEGGAPDAGTGPAAAADPAKRERMLRQLEAGLRRAGPCSCTAKSTTDLSSPAGSGRRRVITGGLRITRRCSWA